MLRSLPRDFTARLAEWLATTSAIPVSIARTSVIYGMPRAAVDAGAVHEVLALDEIAARLVTIGTGAWRRSVAP